MDRCRLPYICPDARGEAAAVSLPPERPPGRADGSLRRPLRQEARPGTRRSPRPCRAARGVGGGPPRPAASPRVDARTIGRRRSASEARARSVARRATGLAVGLYLLLPLRRA